MRKPHAHDQMSPPDWATAFAALPSETPPADALSRVFAQLPVPSRSRFHKSWWIAAAAVLALAVVMPMSMNLSRHSGASRNPALATDSGIQKLGPVLRRDDGVKNVATRPDVATPSAVNSQPAHSTPTRIAKADRPPRKPHRTQPATPTTDPPANAMEPLYAESARLEALLALARDDRAASATAVALGSDFEARVASIDAALTQPSLSAQRRLDLWRQRVSALRAYASFESTQRALAASGERYDAMLVSID